jgi:hypothetical protein
MNFDQIVGPIFAIIMLEYPLIILSWLLIKSGIVKINRIKSFIYNEHDRKRDIIALITLLIIIVVLFILMIFPIILIIVPKFFSNLPLTLRLFILFGLLIIYVPIYALFCGFFGGLRDVVRAGGSASNVVQQLQGYIYEALEINQEKKNNNIKK